MDRILLVEDDDFFVHPAWGILTGENTYINQLINVPNEISKIISYNN